ncbi:DUF2252 domain-containing protein [Rheinheimera mesophila]|uniref:DUF2252 domain-containing protein n=1 Tax=Rheinheimera mesophila TaxID=1547515 RepID=A0A3P3QD45_9GAMM|nr:DUF2252 family protein [Rheinheimera mesophila]KKL02333.1 hypothetical protein SD53_05380 [Rheinheimera mesophila]RRJ19031.1 DUF2252 domain-containing protein [Rheinheimera mesophila]
MQNKVRVQQLQQEFKRTDGTAPGIDPVLTKHQKMALNPFRFLRGSSGLFYADIKHSVLKLPESLTTQIPLTTVIGDCHLSNFGFFTEEGSSGDRVIFAPNDFDDACMGHAVWDWSRFAVSILLAAEYCQGMQQQRYANDNKLALDALQVVSAKDAAQAVHAFLLAYVAQCQAILDEPELRYSVLDDFPKNHVLKPVLKKAIKRSAKGEDFLRKSTLAKSADLSARPLRFKQDSAKFCRLSPELYQEVELSFRPYVSDDILDIVSRQGAGTGSLNMQRYYLLVGPKDMHAEEDLALCHVVEAKQQREAAPLYFFPDLSPVNRLNAAHLTVDCQRLMQRRPDLVLDEHYWNGAHYLLRSLHHANVDVDPEDVCFAEKAPGDELAEYAEACGRTLALSHSRGDRRSYRFEQAVVRHLPAAIDELVQSCIQYAEQQQRDCQLLAELLSP